MIRRGTTTAMCGGRSLLAALLGSALALWLLLPSYSAHWSYMSLGIARKIKFISTEGTEQSHVSWGIVKNDAQYVKRKLEKNKGKILLVTYMRSGSTFVGSMLDANSDIFYVFEPLRALQDFRYGVLHYLNGSHSRVAYETDQQQSIKDIFDCRLKSLSTENLMDMLWGYSTTGKTYRQCTGKLPSRKTVKFCLPILSIPCSQRNATAIKTIRIPMRTVERMIMKDQSLKVIHLVRDPRPTLYSQIRWDYITRRDLNKDSHNHCQNVNDDILITRRLLSIYPKNIKLVFYEDVTIDTLEVVRDIYKFMEMPFTKEVVDHIMNITSVEQKNCRMCIGRSNSTHQLLKWRTSIQFADVEVIDRNCKAVYDNLGYLSARSERVLRNLSMPLRNIVSARIFS